MGIKKVPFDYSHPGKRKTPKPNPAASSIMEKSAGPKRKESKSAQGGPSKSIPAAPATGENDFIEVGCKTTEERMLSSL